MDLRCKYSPSLGVAVTGATGYIGNRLVDILGADSFSPTPVEDVAPGTALVHLGAAVANSRDAMLANLAADSWLVELAQGGKFSRIIYASTNNVYPRALECRLDERTRCNDHYAASKVFGERLMAEFSQVPTVSIRIADVFGVGQKHGNFFKAIEQSLASGTPLKKFGLGLKRRTYIHVDDLCALLRYFIAGNSGIGEAHTVFNAGYPDSASVADILEVVSRVAQLPIEEVPMMTDSSALDVRTMQVSLPDDAGLNWSNFEDALTAYVRQIIASKR
ncbi:MULTISPECIES: NAD(P)-dependent oxidoreductase [Achromobacter]|uniref:NAD-dependent epimerase/dehydratase family protein n=1 Tax=Achromobacter TaxID=222 RepID=UPI0025C1B796|nr:MULTISPECIES: SDR family oxidoreductase [Achromobacter]